MLRIEIVNDGTGDIVFGNYNYRVFINAKLVKKGKIKHNRLTGWQGLLSCLDKKINKDRYRE